MLRVEARASDCLNCLDKDAEKVQEREGPKEPPERLLAEVENGHEMG